MEPEMPESLLPDSAAPQAAYPRIRGGNFLERQLPSACRGNGSLELKAVGFPHVGINPGRGATRPLLTITMAICRKPDSPIRRVGRSSLGSEYRLEAATRDFA